MTLLFIGIAAIVLLPALGWLWWWSGKPISDEEWAEAYAMLEKGERLIEERWGK